MKIRILCATVLLSMMSLASIVVALNPLDDSDWASDPDMDGLINRDEFTAGSDPNNWDTDGDGLPDGWEYDNSLDPADPTDAENDNDYFGGEEYASYTQVLSPYTNYDEYFRFAYVDTETGDVIYLHTDPNSADTDGDKILDPDDPNPWGFGDIIDPNTGIPVSPKPHPGPPSPDDLKDSDKDGLLDKDEYPLGTDPFNPDTDGDGLTDPMEITYGLDPNDWDTDNDMLIDGVEEGEGQSTDGHVEDTDNDGTPGDPGVPVPPKPYPWTPSPDDLKDSDHDGLLDKDEYQLGTDPFNPDTDGDGLSDPMEFSLSLDPNDWDTDDDMLIDGVEMGSGDSTDGHVDDADNDGTPGGPGNPVPPKPNPGPPQPDDLKDSDHDGLLDKDEYQLGTDPFNPDTDGDGLSDPMEFSLGLDPNDWDTDNDMLIDGVEMGSGDSTDGHVEDSNNDGIA